MRKFWTALCTWFWVFLSSADEIQALHSDIKFVRTPRKAVKSTNDIRYRSLSPLKKFWVLTLWSVHCSCMHLWSIVFGWSWSCQVCLRGVWQHRGVQGCQGAACHHPVQGQGADCWLCWRGEKWQHSLPKLMQMYFRQARTSPRKGSQRKKHPAG